MEIKKENKHFLREFFFHMQKLAISNQIHGLIWVCNTLIKAKYFCPTCEVMNNCPGRPGHLAQVARLLSTKSYVHINNQEIILEEALTFFSYSSFSLCSSLVYAIWWTGGH
jgi:hypothetical protein